MKLGNVKDIFKDWVKSGYYFGKTFSNFVADKLEMTSNKARMGTAVFDTAAGALITYSGVTSFLGTAIGAVVALGFLASAPATALGTIVLAPIFMALSTVWTGVGVGLLSSAADKFGLTRSEDVGAKVRPLARETSGALSNLLARGKKISADFSAAMKKEAATPATPAAPAAKPENKGPSI